MDMSALLECPFCGAAATCEGDEAIEDCGFWVQCTGCKVEQMDLHRTREAAVTAWNRRVVPSTTRFTLSQPATDDLGQQG